MRTPHRVETRIRVIPPDQLPVVRGDDDGTERPATEQELLNLGIIPLDEPDHYECREQERRDSTGTWRPLVELPGEIVARGPVTKRYRELPEPARARVLRAHVYRRTDGRSLAEHYAELMERAAVPVEARRDVTLGRARERAAQEGYPVERAEIAMGDVDAGDVVEATAVPPHKWSGENER